MRSLWLAAALAACAAPAAAQTKGDLVLAAPQVRASLGQSPNTAAYLTVRNRGARPDRLLSATCRCAARVELHTHRMQGGIARMERVPALSVPPRGQAVLAPGGAHLMLFGLKQPIREGESRTITLVFERAGAVSVSFAARSAIAAPPVGHAH